MLASKCSFAVGRLRICATLIALLFVAIDTQAGGDEALPAPATTKDDQDDATKSRIGDSAGWPGRLPSDGAWIRYHWDRQGTDGLKLPGTVTLSFVGSTVEGGKPCRWIELKTTVTDGIGTRTRITKMLMLEAALLESAEGKAKPHSEDVVRTWQRQPDGSVKKLDNPPDLAVYFIWTPGPSKSLTRTGERKDVDYQRGRLKSASGWSGGGRDGRIPQENIIIATEGSWTVWQHPDLPCGFAEAHFRVSFSVTGGINDGFQNDYYVQDAGLDARSELPDYN